MAPAPLFDDVDRLHTNSLFSPQKLASRGVLSGWPQRVNGRAAWKGKDLGSDSDFVIELSPMDVLEIEFALHHFNKLGLDGHEVSQSNFPLRAVGKKLLDAAEDVHNGKGFCCIRGLFPAQYSPEDNMTIFLGISSYIGEKRGRQDNTGNMIAHIRDELEMVEPQDTRPAKYSHRGADFHTDAYCDILALQTLNRAAHGGGSLLASSLNIYNRLASERPDVLKLLAKPDWPFDGRSGQFQDGLRPCIFNHGGHVILNFASEVLCDIPDLPRADALPSLTEAQLDALTIVESIAREDHLAILTQPGDLIFVNNFSILHSREDFKDDDVYARYLVRVWLKNEKLAWKLPKTLQVGENMTYEERAGLPPKKWNVLAVPKTTFEVFERFSL